MKNGAIVVKSLLTAITLFCLVAGSAQATVLEPQLPRLDIQALFGNSDAGVVVDNGTLSIDATVIAIITDVSGNSVDLADEDFTLNGSLNGGGTYDGSLTAGSYLSADFTGLTLQTFTSSSGEIFGSVTYTGGSLQGAFTGGDILLSYNNATPSFPLAAGKLGPVVVPVPAAVWLFGSGLIGLVSVARRKALS